MNDLKLHIENLTLKQIQISSLECTFTVNNKDLTFVTDDGLNLPRKQGVNGSPLPSPRQVSNAVHRGTKDVTSPFLTLHAFQFGQFLDHDVISTPVTSGKCLIYGCFLYGLYTL